MSEPKWVPWRYVGGGQVQGSDGKQVAWLAGRSQRNDSVHGYLIAAAPELAKFAEKVHAFSAASNAPDGDDYLNEGGHEVLMALENEAAELLAKARGETEG